MEVNSLPIKKKKYLTTKRADQEEASSERN
jgi:hypothetical protein